MVNRLKELMSIFGFYMRKQMFVKSNYELTSTDYHGNFLLPLIGEAAVKPKENYTSEDISLKGDTGRLNFNYK